MIHVLIKHLSHCLLFITIWNRLNNVTANSEWLIANELVSTKYDWLQRCGQPVTAFRGRGANALYLMRLPIQTIWNSMRSFISFHFGRFLRNWALIVYTTWTNIIYRWLRGYTNIENKKSRRISFKILYRWNINVVGCDYTTHIAYVQ